MILIWLNLRIWYLNKKIQFFLIENFIYFHSCKQEKFMFQYTKLKLCKIKRIRIGSAIQNAECRKFLNKILYQEKNFF